MNFSHVRTAAIAAIAGASLTMGVQALAQHQGQTPHSDPHKPTHQGAMQHGSMNHGSMQPGAKKLHEMMMKSASDMMHMKMPMDNDTDRMFDKSMADHHLMGVQMAQIEIRYGNDPDSKRMASKIIAAQTKERAQLLRLAAKAK